MVPRVVHCTEYPLPPDYTVFKSVYLPSQYRSPNERNFSSLMIIVQEKKWLEESITFHWTILQVHYTISMPTEN